MIEVFHILREIYDPEVSKGILKLSSVITTRGHSMKLFAPMSRLETAMLTLILVPDRRSGHNNSKIASARSHTYLW